MNCISSNHKSYITLFGPKLHEYTLTDLPDSKKKALRIICNVPPLSTTHHLFQQCTIMPLPDLYNYIAGVFLYKYSNNLLPSTFSARFVLTPYISNATRNANRKLYKFPKCRTSIRFNSVKAQLCIVFNQLISPLNIHENSSLYLCKKSLKSIFY